MFQSILSWILEGPRRAEVVNCASLLEVESYNRKGDETNTPRRTGTVDHRLLRENLIRSYRMGRVSKDEICDATEELLRVADHFGEDALKPCPICGGSNLVYVGFAFGTKLPSSGQVVPRGVTLEDMVRLKEFDMYQVEVCKACLWNHLVQKQAIDRD